jgi:hypothetical protein
MTTPLELAWTVGKGVTKMSPNIPRRRTSRRFAQVLAFIGGLEAIYPGQLTSNEIVVNGSSSFPIWESIPYSLKTSFVA